MSYQGEPSDIEISAKREPLETAAALQLGLLLITLSRLDLLLDQYLAKAGAAPGAVPLKRLMEMVDRVEDPALRASFRQWMVRAHRLESLRTQLAKGRWLPDRRRDCVVCELPGAVPAEFHASDLASWVGTLKDMVLEFRQLCATEREAHARASADFMATQPA